MTLNPLLEPNWVQSILPEIILCVGGMLLILLEAFTPRLRNTFAGLTALILVMAALSETLVPSGDFFGGMWQVNALTRLFDFTFLLAALLCAMLAKDYLAREGVENGEFYALLLWATVGMTMMASLVGT